MTRHKVELSHKITVLSQLALNPDRDTISLLSEKRAKELNDMINKMWLVIERRAKR